MNVLKGLVIALLILCFHSQAFSSEGWRCVGSTEADSMALANLKLNKDIYSKSTQSVLIDQDKYCQLVHEIIFNDACEFEGHYLTVGVGQTSRLKTSSGKKIVLFCQNEK